MSVPCQSIRLIKTHLTNPTWSKIFSILSRTTSVYFRVNALHLWNKRLLCFCSQRWNSACGAAAAATQWDTCDPSKVRMRSSRTATHTHTTSSHNNVNVAPLSASTSQPWAQHCDTTPQPLRMTGFSSACIHEWIYRNEEESNRKLWA